MGYDQNKAAAYNKLIQGGASEEEAARQAGIGPADDFNYSVGDNGLLGPLVVGSGARNNEVIVKDQPPQSTYPQTAARMVTAVTKTSTQTDSTEYVSGGGTTTIVSGQPKATQASREAAVATASKQAELDQFIKDNPSNFIRKRQGLPPLSPEENEAREAKRRELEDQVSSASNGESAAKTPGLPTVINTPNTTTTTRTVDYQTSTEKKTVPYVSDPELDQAQETAFSKETRPASQTSATPGATGSSYSLPTQADYAALRQAQIDANGGVDPFPPPDPELQAQLDRINDRKPGPPLGTIQEQLAAAGLTPPASQLDAETQAALDRINARKAETANTPYTPPTPQDNIASLNAAGFSAPAPTAEEQATIDALNRIEARKAETANSPYTPPTPQDNIASLNAAGFSAPTPTAEEQATIDALNRIDARKAGEVPPQAVNPVAYDDEGNLLPGFELNENGDPVRVSSTPTVTTFTPKAVPPSQAGPVGTPYDDDGNLNPGWTLDENNNPVYVGGNFVEPATQASANASREQAAQEAAIKAKAKAQATFQARYKQPGNQDWRVRLSLSPNAQYLYNAGTPRGSGAGILKPLCDTDGVIFPYTPSITTTYSANYEQYDLVHSNYRGVYYKNSRVGDINIRATFTAQDTTEANYLLAVIHFFRSATKMFYGQDAERGTPPPVCLLNGLGQYQFSDHPVVISSFNYTLPTDVDYIRATNPNNYGVNLLNRRTPVASNPGGSSLAGLNRLLNALPLGLSKGAIPNTPAPGSVNQSVNNTAGATYVPTKLEIDITLIPVQTRAQVSKQFSLKGFANGDLLKGGFW